MRRSRRKLLRWFGALLLLVAVLGGVAVTGHLPPLNRRVEQRLLAELRAAGVDTAATRLRELSWRRAVAGPVRLQAPGLHVELAEARAELGWRVLAGMLAPRVVLRGLTAEVDLARWSELAGSLPGDEGGWTAATIDLEDARLVLRNGAARIEVPVAGEISADSAELRVRLTAAAPAFSGRIALCRGPEAGGLELAVEDGDFAAEPWRMLLAGLVDAPLAAARFASDGRIQISATARLAGGRWAALNGEARLPEAAWSEGGHAVSLGRATVRAKLEASAAGEWSVAADRCGWNREGWRVELVGPELTVAAEGVRVHFPDGVFNGSGLALRGAGDATVRGLFGDAPATAEAVVRLATGEVLDWRLTVPAEVRARWDGAELGVALGAAALEGPCRLQLADIAGTVGGWREGSPRFVARGQAAVGLDGLGAAKEAPWRCEPALVGAKFSASGLLDAGAEAARIEFTVPAMRRTFAFPGGRFEAVLGGEAVVNVDRAHVSGRATVEAHDVLARQGGWSALAPEASFAVQWPRVWQAALARSHRSAGDPLWRELWWSGDYELKVGEAIVRRGEGGWCATGVAVQARSRGAELHESGGATIGATAGELTDGSGRRATNVTLDAVFGLGAGRLRLGGSVPELALTMEAEQTVRWEDGLVAEGTYGIGPATLSGREPLTRWWPALEGFEIDGGVSLSGTDRLENGTWHLGGSLVLHDLGVRWPARAAAVEGLRGRIAWSGPEWRTEPEQTIAWARASVAGVEVLNGVASFGLDEAGTLAVARFEGGALGGRVESAPFAVAWERPEFETRLTLTSVRMEDLLRLTENVPAEAQGALDGSMPLRWRDGRLGVGTGYLRLAPGEIGRMRFTRDLRLLTSGRRPGSAEYNALRRIEESMMELVFNRLQVDTYPKDASGQSARIRLVGAPSEGEPRMPVSLDVNVNAPLEHFLNLRRGKPAASRGAAK